ncbi:MAG: purine-binding chemotaxis protein CheW [Spirochaetales bacterium]|nr:purine-binding chemotaxis protein CheW [Spirochaetales bacterium]HNQ96885.1 chemotaxis protein CheW [Treponemataceae bacterium]
MVNKAEIRQYLTFKLADEQYAINVANIKEVLGIPKITKVPRMPPFMTGIINLRGSVVPILDLKKKFALGETIIGKETGIIVIELAGKDGEGNDEQLVVGIFSDEVQKVITIEESEIEGPPQIGIAIDTAFIQGMGHVDGGFIIILNIDKILTDSEIHAIAEQGDQSELAMENTVEGTDA